MMRWTSLTSFMGTLVMGVALGLASSCGGGDDDDAMIDAAPGQPDAASGQPDAASGQPDAPTSSTCEGVCAACFDAMNAGCASCPAVADPDCAMPDAICGTAREIQTQFSCDACAAGLAMEAACDGT